jgi:fumarylacetoacetase
LKSWVDSANDPAVGSPLQCLPYCSFQSPDHADDFPHLGVGIGSLILDLKQMSQAGLLAPLGAQTQTACREPQLNALMRCGPIAWSALRKLLIDLLREGADRKHERAVTPCLFPKRSARYFKPVAIPNYTDFYASIHHATNVGRLFRPDQPLLPNYKWVPIGYHGRASSIVVSGTEVRRPSGQHKRPNSDIPTFGPSTQLDYELEVAAYIGTGNPLGSPIAIEQAEAHIFGVTLLNDWSARDIQSWEYQPLGPFLGKSFATSVSPWVTPIEALQPFRVPLELRAEGDPAPLPYLAHSASSFEIKLEVLLTTASMRAANLAPIRLSESNTRDLYWSFPQLVTHHTSNGCNLEIGDLLASGTVSGPEPGSQGCLLEITQRGASPLTLPNGERRTFLEDGDEIILRGFCERDGLPRMALGECRGTILPATALPATLAI